jgi:hypothetical protein
MAIKKRAIEAAPIMPATAMAEALIQLCPDLDRWPQRWSGDDSDIPFGERIVERLKPFLLHLLKQGLATKTLKRHRDHLWMLGGEIIRRFHADPTLRRKSINTVLLESLDPDGGPLIWPRITEQQQDSLDATCRKLYQFLTTKHKPLAQRL